MMEKEEKEMREKVGKEMRKKLEKELKYKNKNSTTNQITNTFGKMIIKIDNVKH